MKLMLLALLLAFTPSVDADRTPAPSGAEVYFIQPMDGAVVEGPVHVVFGLRGMGQTETTIDLPAGVHTLQPVLGDHLHIPHNPSVKSEIIRITVR